MPSATCATVVPDGDLPHAAVGQGDPDRVAHSAPLPRAGRAGGLDGANQK